MRPTCRPAPVLFFLLLLGGCATYRPAPIDPARVAGQWQGRRLDDPAILDRIRRVLPADRVGDWPPRTWGRGELLAAALVLNPDLAEARAHLAEAAAAVTTARAWPNPTVGLALERYTRAQADASPWLWGISTELALDTALRRRLRRELADAQVRAARLDYAERVWRVRAALRDAGAERLAAGRQLALATQAATLAAEIQAASEQRRALGEDSAAAVLQAAQALAQARTIAAAADQRAAVAQAALARAIGVPGRALDGIRLDPDGYPDDPPGPSDTELARLRDQARLSRPDLERALVAYQQSETGLHQQIRAQYPRLSLGPGYTYDHGLQTLTFGASASLPVFNRNQGPIAAARARREAAAAHVRVVEADIDSQIQAATTRLAAARRALQAARAGAQAARRQREQARRAFALGAIGRLQWLAAQSAMVAAEQARLAAAAQVWQARASLEDALHTPLDAAEARLWPKAGEHR